MRVVGLIFLFCCLSPSQDLRFHPVTSDVLAKQLALAVKENSKRGLQLRALFEESGCTGEALAEQKVSKKGPPNLICTLKGETENTIIVGAHFDALGSEGFADNWSGSVLLPALYRALAREPRKHTYVFVGFTDEEKGLLGSKHFVKQMTKEQIARTHAMINLDTIGLAPLTFWASRANPDLQKYFQVICTAMKHPIHGVNIEQVGSTDSESFAPTRIRRISFSSVLQENFGILHTPMDRLERINVDTYHTSYRLLALYLAYLDDKLATF